MATAVLRFLKRGKLRWVLMLVALGITACYVSGSDADPVPPPSAEDLDRAYSAEALRADLDHLVGAIEGIHPDPYFQLSRETFHAEAETVRDALDAPLTRTAFYLRIAPLVARLGDGHTGVQLPMPEVRRHLATGGLLFPLNLGFVGGRAFVTRSFEGIDAGAEVVAVDGQPMAAILARFSNLFGSQREAHRQAQVETYFPYLMWLSLGSRPEFEVLVAGPEGAEATRHTLGARSLDQLREGSELSPDAIRYAYYTYETDPTGRFGLMTIDYFVGLDDFDRFLTASFARMESDGVDHLVIDLTDNGGGTTNVSNELLRYLSDVPVQTYASYQMKVSAPVRVRLKRQIPRLVRCLPVQYLFPQGRRVWGATVGDMVLFEGERIQPARPNDRFSGSVWVLVNGKTFSTATTFAAAVQDHGLGTLVGEETGGVASFFGDGFPLRLPNTRLDVTISHKRFIRPSGDPGPGGVVPDFDVVPTRADVEAGANPYVEWVRNRIAHLDGALP